MRVSLVAGAVMAMLVLAGCGGGGPAGPTAGPTIALGANDTIFCGVFDEGTPVEIKNNVFTPADVTIAAGEQVDWTNADTATHVIKFDSGTTCGTVMGGTVKKVRFSTAGFFPYYCTIHDDMRGTVTVQ